MLRLDTTQATHVTEAFSPSKAGILQAKIGADSVAKIELLMRVDPDADWLPLALWDPTKDKLFALQPFPFVKIKLIDNKDGERVQIWDSEPAVKPADKGPLTRAHEAEQAKIPLRVKPAKPDNPLLDPEFAEAYERTLEQPAESPVEYDRRLIAEPAEI